MVVGEPLEDGAADEAQLRFPQRLDRGRARGAVKHRQFAQNGARPENGENSLAPGGGDDADLEQAFIQPVAPVRGIAGKEQGLIGLERDRATLGEKVQEESTPRMSPSRRREGFCSASESRSEMFWSRTTAISLGTA